MVFFTFKAMYNMTIHSIFYIYLLLFTLCQIEPVLFLPPELLFQLFLTSGATFLLQKAKILNFPLNTIWNAMLFFWIFLFTCDNSFLWTCYTFILYFVSFATYDILPISQLFVNSLFSWVIKSLRTWFNYFYMFCTV